MSDIKNPQTVKRQLEEADNLVQVLSDTIRRGLKIDPREAQRRFGLIRQKLKYAMDNIRN
tara:strand:+ start:181 stop:360 length:180 start_codon:yes stop_codon:yes gene_type:complete